MNGFYTSAIEEILQQGADEVRNPKILSVIYSLGRDSENDEEYEYAWRMLLVTYQDGTPRVRAACVQAFSMMAIFHKKLDKQIVEPILKEERRNASGENVAIIEDAIDEINFAMGWHL